MTDVQPGDAWIFTDLANLERDLNQHAQRLDAAIAGMCPLRASLDDGLARARAANARLDALFAKADPEGRTDPSNRRAALEQFMDYQRRLKNGNA